MTITFKELLGSHTIAEVPIAHQQNMQELLKRLEPVREAWNKPMVVTSGYRSLEEHYRIYSMKGTPRDKVPLQSAHLYGMAVDIADEGLLLTDWLKHDRVGCTMLQAHNLYCEEGNKNWVHFSTRAPKSGHRWFLP